MSASRRSSAALRDQSGQSAVELVAGLPALFVVALVLLQLLAVGWAATLAGGAAEAGALAVAAGRPAEPAARSALPDWSRGRVRVAERGGVVSVWVRPPSPVRALRERLEVQGQAAVAGG